MDKKEKKYGLIILGIFVVVIFLVNLCQLAFGEDVAVITDNSVHISWVANPEVDVNKYRVFGKRIDLAAWQQIAEVNDLYTSWQYGNEAKEQFYHFSLKAVDIAGNESQMSGPSIPAWIDGGIAPSVPLPPTLSGYTITYIKNLVINY